MLQICHFRIGFGIGLRTQPAIAPERYKIVW